MQGTVVVLKETSKIKEPALVTETGVGANGTQIYICKQDGGSGFIYVQEVERYATKEELVKFVSALKETHPHMVQHLIKFVAAIEGEA